MEELERQEHSRQERIAKAVKDLTDAELELQSLPPFDPPIEKIVNQFFFTEIFLHKIIIHIFIERKHLIILRLL